MTWTINFYSDKVYEETQALPKGIKASLTRTLDLIVQFGPDLGRPHTAPLERGLYEIRAKGHEGIARSLYCTTRGREVVILLTAVKKSDKLPKRYMDTARKRMKEVHDND
jgi:phage-related protein